MGTPGVEVGWRDRTRCTGQVKSLRIREQLLRDFSSRPVRSVSWLCKLSPSFVKAGKRVTRSSSVSSGALRLGAGM